MTNYGFLNVNKPSGPTSHDVVASVRRATGIRRVGHAGTLDPLAAGVLVLAVGPATRLIEYLALDRKRYIAEIQLGVTTDTYDSQGAILAQVNPAGLTENHIMAALANYTGDIRQRPPAYSAIKIGGRPAYARARLGEVVELQARTVSIFALSLLSFRLPTLKLYVECSGGTYIRSLAHDIGMTLGCGATLFGLLRTASGKFLLENAVELHRFEQAVWTGAWSEYLVSPEAAISGISRINVTVAEASNLLQGRAIHSGSISFEKALAYNQAGDLIAVLRSDAANHQWIPAKILASASGRITQPTQSRHVS